MTSSLLPLDFRLSWFAPRGSRGSPFRGLGQGPHALFLPPPRSYPTPYYLPPASGRLPLATYLPTPVLLTFTVFSTSAPESLRGAPVRARVRGRRGGARLQQPVCGGRVSRQPAVQQRAVPARGPRRPLDMLSLQPRRQRLPLVRPPHAQGTRHLVLSRRLPGLLGRHRRSMTLP